MEEEIEKITKERDDYLEGWKRAKADFVNYKKEEETRMQRMAEFARGELLLRMLPIFDNLQRAEQRLLEERSQDSVYRGVLQIISQWKEFLKSEGIEEIQTVGMPFDFAVHEAIGEVEGEEHGIVAEELEKGYMMNGKLLRVAKVKVTK